MNIVFAKTRYHYDSYIDFWKLVELSDFETIYVDEVDVSKHYAVILSPFNGEWQPHIDNQVGRPRNAHLIHWCLERPSGAGGIGNYAKSNRMHMYRRLFDDVWVSDRRLASECVFRFVVLGCDYGLGEPGSIEDKRYIFAHMSYVADRRARVYNVFGAEDIAPNCWLPERHKVLQQSKFGLCIHKDNHPFQEPLRLALFAAYGLPLLIEDVHDAYPWSEEFCVFHPYDGITGRLRQMIDNVDYQRWYDLGLLARDRMCTTFRFRAMVLQAVKDSMV